MYHPPPDIPALHCHGLRPGIPCPWPEQCDCWRDDDDTSFVMSLLFVVVAAIILVLTGWPVLAADNDVPCLTKQAARAKYPGRYLYWHTAQHCWDATSGHRPVLHPRPKPNIEPDGNAVQQKVGTVAYPSLMAGGGTDSAMLRADTMMRWPPVMDFDEPPLPFVPWNERALPIFEGKHERTD
jgi:hypothetical protein